MNDMNELKIQIEFAKLHETLERIEDSIKNLTLKMNQIYIKIDEKNINNLDSSINKNEDIEKNKKVIY